MSVIQGCLLIQTSLKWESRAKFLSASIQMTCRNVRAPWKIAFQQVAVPSVTHKRAQFAPNKLPLIGYLLNFAGPENGIWLLALAFRVNYLKMIQLKSYMLLHKPSQNPSQNFQCAWPSFLQIPHSSTIRTRKVGKDKEFYCIVILQIWSWDGSHGVEYLARHWRREEN